MAPFLPSSKDVSVVIKRHAHDVRNALNGMELELILLDEGASDPAVRDAVKRLREAGAEISRLMQGLSSKYGMEPPCVIPAIQIAEQWNDDARHVAFGASLHWNVQLRDENVFVEAALVRSLLRDTLEMAVRLNRKQALQINCRRDGGRIDFEIAAEHSKASTAIIDSQQSYWAALRAMAEGRQIRMRPEMLSSDESRPMGLSLLVHQPSSEMG